MFFFKQKTAYDMRISDWSSDVCSSDLLFERDGQTLTELEAALPQMTRFGVMKHLRVLEDAGLVTTRRAGRRKLHYLNPVPIRQIGQASCRERVCKDV